MLAGMQPYPELHDAQLKSIALRWAEKEVVIEIWVSAGAFSLVLAGVTAFQASCRDPWGPSASINEGWWSEPAGDEPPRFVIEMQSGDRIEVTAASVTIDTLPATG